MPTAIELRFFEVNDVRLAVELSGEPHLPLAILLHGFPDTPSTWRHLRDDLAGAGYRVAAPFLRGYAPSGLAPDGRYHAEKLALDVLALADRLSPDRPCVLIGHDYGVSAATLAAAVAPHRVTRLVTMAIPPRGALRENPPGFAQLKRSWYMYFFGTPAVFAALESDLAGFIGGLWSDWSPGYDAHEDVAAFVAAASPVAHLHATIDYYRSSSGRIAPDPALAEVRAARERAPSHPNLYLHGRRDGCVGIEMSHNAEAHLPPRSRVRRIDDAGHFLHLERPEIVAAEILSFLRETPPSVDAW